MSPMHPHLRQVCTPSAVTREIADGNRNHCRYEMSKENISGLYKRRRGCREEHGSKSGHGVEQDEDVPDKYEIMATKGSKAFGYPPSSSDWLDE